MSSPYQDSPAPFTSSNDKVHSYDHQEDRHDRTSSDNIDDNTEVTRVRTTGNKYVHLGNKTYLREDLQAAFGGDFNPGLHTAPRLRLGNPSPMGLMAFSATTLILSLLNTGARGVHNNSVVLGCALFHGGAVQIFAGLWELVSENTFGATVFATYGGFWMSFAVLNMGGFNINSSYKSDTELANAMGLYFVVWSIVTFLFLLCTLRSTLAMFTLLFTLMLTFILLAASEMTSTYPHLAGQSANLMTAAGVIGCIVGFTGFYNAMAGLLKPENSWISMRAVYMPGALRPEQLKEA